MTNLSKLLKNIINEEIDLALKDISTGIFLEQMAPPVAPAAPAPPATPPDPAAAAPPADEADKADTGDEDKDDLTKKIEALAKRSDEDIEKTFKAGLQDGSKQKETMDILSKVINSLDKDTPENVKRVATEFQKDFDINVPEEVGEEAEDMPPAAPVPPVPGQPPVPSAPPATPAPIKESRLQTSLREYLHYKKLYQRTSKRK